MKLGTKYAVWLGAPFVALMFPGVGEAKCPEIPAIARDPSTGSPFATGNKGVTTLDTQTSDNVRITGGCIGGTIISRAVCDGATDDSAVIAGELIRAYAAGELELPAGTCEAAGLVISQAIHIKGRGRKKTKFRMPLGSTAPAITITVSSAGDGNFPQVVELSNLQITSHDKTDAAGQNVAHGIKLLSAASPISTKVTLNNVIIDNVPGDGIHAGAGEFGSGSWVEAHNTDLTLPNGNGIYANSTTDWRWFGGEWYGATLDNFICSGCAHFRIVGVNSYSAQQYNHHFFNADNIAFVGGSADRSYKDGVFVDNRTGGKVFYSGGFTFGFSGRLTNATYSDLTLSANNTGHVYLDGTAFFDPADAGNTDPNKPLRNITFTGGDLGIVFANHNRFEGARNWLSSTATNLPRLYAGNEPPAAWPTAPTVVGSSGGTATTTVQVASISTIAGSARVLGRVVTSSLAGLTGNLRISGLPVPPVSTSNDNGICTLGNALGWTAPANFSWLIGFLNGASSATQILLFRNSVNGTANAETAVGEWAAASAVNFSCDYKYIADQ